MKWLMVTSPEMLFARSHWAARCAHERMPRLPRAGEPRARRWCRRGHLRRSSAPRPNARGDFPTARLDLQPCYEVSRPRHGAILAGQALASVWFIGAVAASTLARQLGIGRSASRSRASTMHCRTAFASATAAPVSVVAAIAAHVSVACHLASAGLAAAAIAAAATSAISIIAVAAISTACARRACIALRLPPRCRGAVDPSRSRANSCFAPTVDECGCDKGSDARSGGELRCDKWRDEPALVFALVPSSSRLLCR